MAGSQAIFLGVLIMLYGIDWRLLTIYGVASHRRNQNLEYSDFPKV
jgi:hypothetical protein